ncbi:hypothetical protein GCM10020331_095920 [Ectobacillus funiculus]
MQTPGFKPRRFIERSNVQFVGTTDDPVDTLEYHQLLQNDPTFHVEIVPTFRPDGALFLLRSRPFKNWLEKN